LIVEPAENVMICTLTIVFHDGEASVFRYPNIKSGLEFKKIVGNLVEPNKDNIVMAMTKTDNCLPNIWLNPKWCK